MVPYYRRDKPLSDGNKFFTDLDYSFEEATQIICSDYPGKSTIFIKEFMLAVAGRFETFLDKKFTHSFLIRNPKRVNLSYYKRLNGTRDPGFFKELCLRGDVGFSHIHNFYFLLKNRLGVDPVIIDADDLLANPEKMMEAYCKRVGLTYKQGMTKWEPGSGWDPNFQDQLLFISDWADEAIGSSGFKELTPLPTVPDDLPVEYVECMEECFKPYNELYSLRLTV